MAKPLVVELRQISMTVEVAYLVRYGSFHPKLRVSVSNAGAGINDRTISDLRDLMAVLYAHAKDRWAVFAVYEGHISIETKKSACDALNLAVGQRHRVPARSEEHTSELQSLMRISYAVFCL